MVNKKFEAYKVERELKRSGEEYEIKRKEKNEFGEPSGELNVIGKIKGIYHEQNSTISITTNDTTQIRSKKVPMILCLYKDTNDVGLQVGDVVNINSKTF